MKLLWVWNSLVLATFDSAVNMIQDRQNKNSARTRVGGAIGMSQATHFETAPEDRIPFIQKVIFGAGAFVNNILAYAMGGMVIVLNLGLGMNPALVGLLGALPRLTDALTDPLMGYISDNTRSRWGRRRPYIFCGAITVAIIFAALWQLPLGKSEAYYFWWFLGGSLIFYLAYTMFATPWVALGYELTPDYHERTRLMGVQNFIGQLAYIIGPYFLAIMNSKMLFDNMVDGAAGLAIVIAISVALIGVLPAIFLRERFVAKAAEEALQTGNPPESSGSVMMRAIREFFSGFVTSLKFKPFLKLCAATFLVFNGFMLIAAFQTYVIIFYIFAGDTDQGAVWAGHAGALGAFSTFFIIALITWLCPKYGKRRAFYATTSLSIVGYLLKWFCYTPETPWLLLLPVPLIAFGFGGLFTLMPAMVADVVDADELNTNQRREGMYGSIFWWVVKLGMAAALAAGGFLLNATGFDVALGTAQTDQTLFLMRIFDIFVPIGASILAIWAVASYTITEEKAHEVRMKLEARRGT
jgi:GPH family glycoside/pentoside/hexuronide:cation symporter